MPTLAETQARKVLYFTVDAVPNSSELAEIARIVGKVYVRNGKTVADTKYGENLESADYVAGPNIPTAYAEAHAETILIVPSSTAADQFALLPATLTIDASDADKQQMVAAVVTIDPATGLATVTNLAADATVTYVSSDTNKATVSSTGLVTAVAAGETTITATYTPGTAKTGGAAEADDDIVTLAAHGFNTGDAVKLVSLSGGTGLTAGTVYYAIRLSTNTLKLATTRANAVAGTAVNVTVDGTSVVLVAAPQTATCVVTVAA